MAMIDIEYRYAKGQVPGGDFPGREIRRHTVKEMEEYLRNLVYEMQSADISVKFTTGVPAEGERNMVYINGKSVPSILEGLDIKIPEPDEETCGCSAPKIVTIGGPNLEWNTEFIEDIPDILMKNAISKMYADMEKNRIM